MAAQGFIAVYRWRVPAAEQDAFRARWREVTQLGREHGAYGSCLTRDVATGDLVAVALWSSEGARREAFERMGALAWPAVERLGESRLEVLDDLWALSPFRED